MKKHHHILFFIFLAGLNLAYAQNLVSNPSFEEYTECPPSNGYVENCVGWYSATATADYCNACAPLLSGVSIPSNTYGYQQPYDGSAYMGGAAYVQGYEYRECIRGTLIEPLVVGTKYYVSFKVSLAENQSNCGSNKIGALFANDQYTDASTLALNLNYAHIYTNSIITDTVNWTTVSGSFVADSAYSYIVIGNFFDNTHTDMLRVQTSLSISQSISYYYIDDVCVSTNPVSCNVTDTTSQSAAFIMPTAFTPNDDNVNDKYFPVLSNATVEIFRIYNRWGQIIHNNPNEGWDGKYKDEPQPIDVYGYYTEIKDDISGKIEKRTGSFTLLR